MQRLISFAIPSEDSFNNSTATALASDNGQQQRQHQQQHRPSISSPSSSSVGSFPEARSYTTNASLQQQPSLQRGPSLFYEQQVAKRAMMRQFEAQQQQDNTNNFDYDYDYDNELGHSAFLGDRRNSLLATSPTDTATMPRVRLSNQNISRQQQQFEARLHAVQKKKNSETVLDAMMVAVVVKYY